ncbi:MAG TPA: histidine--tRNA ligase [Gemmatimonadales bacterium]|jgi:histidyl-tRNA synthetase|nr:histidine--tRNA ligase [Gemmatimonadales bacterium]
MQPQALPGFRDFYPADFALRAHLFRTWRTVAARYGFEEYDGPPLEPLELYTAKSGEEIVGQLYRFTDKGDREVALRPEMTPTLARMVAARASALKKPIRWFSIPQLFRYERQQRGRLREHFQLNCDLIGEAGHLADAEIVALAIDAVRAFGLGPGDVRVRLSDRRLLTAVFQGLGVSDSQVPLVYQVFDKLRRTPEETSVARLSGAGLPGATIDRLLTLARARSWSDLGGGLDSALAQGDSLRRTLEALEAMGFGEYLDLDLSIVRGLAYYTGTVFELFDARGELRAICGGGRYDNLLQSLGGVDLPALGFGMGDVVLTELLRDRGLVPEAAPGIDVFLAAIGQDDLPEVLGLARELREAGLRVEYALAPQAVGKQLQLADARKARAAVIVGPDDRARGEVMLKDLQGKSQQSVRRDAVRERLASLVGLRGTVSP